MGCIDEALCRSTDMCAYNGGGLVEMKVKKSVGRIAGFAS